jgi:hypothetical protein
MIRVLSLSIQGLWRLLDGKTTELAEIVSNYRLTGRQVQSAAAQFLLKSEHLRLIYFVTIQALIFTPFSPLSVLIF